MGNHSFDYRIRLDRRVADYQAHYERLTTNTFLLDRKVFVCLFVCASFLLVLTYMITSNPCGFFYCSCNVAPAQVLVLHLKSLKKGVRNKFLTPFNSHFLLFHVTATIKSTRFSVIICRIITLENYFLSSRSVLGNLRRAYLTSFWKRKTILIS